jgi:ABC-2 type transport system permease protein
MKNIFLILRREYMVRVRKRSFVVMTLLGPLLTAGFYGLVIWSAVKGIEQKTVTVLDQSRHFAGKFKNSDELLFQFSGQSLDAAKKSLTAGKTDVVVFIPPNILNDAKGVRMLAQKSIGFELQRDIEKTIEREIENVKLARAGITTQILQDARMNVDAETISVSAEGESNSNAIAASAIGYACAILIYITVFIYGVQVMRSVMEEKTNRIVEVIISSVRPFDLLMGKVIGVGLVGLTQFMLWIGLTWAVSSASTAVLGFNRFDGVAKAQTEINSPVNPNAVAVQPAPAQAGQAVAGAETAPAKAKAAPEESGMSKFLKSIQALNLPLIISCFLFFYLGGYLLYSALFGAVGAAVDNETDTQQFMLPITLPIIASFVFAQFVIRDPDGSLAFWASIIPLTSPIIMMVRIPFGVPGWQIALSMVLLVAGFMGTIWLAGRIYRVGILMYGKKITYKELSKWVFYKG